MKLRSTILTALAATGFLLSGARAVAASPTPAPTALPTQAAPAMTSATAKTADAGGVLGTAHAAKPKHKHKVYQAASDAVPDFTLTQVINGKPFHLRKHLGQVVLIDFWATWCGPCRMAIPHLVELQKKYGGRDFTVVGVSLDQQGPAVVRPFAQQWNLNYPVVVDQDGSLARDYGGVRSIPTTLVIDREGRVVGDPLIGYRPYEEYEQLVKQALKAG